MLNLDTEDWTEIFIGCAGGGDSVITVKVEAEAAPQECQALEITITGEGRSCGFQGAAADER